MTTTSDPATQSLFADKEILRRILEEQDRQTGFVPDRTLTVERLQEMMLAEGIRPEDCVASRDILQMREE